MGFLSLSGDRIAASKSRMSVVGATFTPKSISGLALWLDGADASTTYTTDAGPVTAVTQPTDIAGCAIWLDGDQSVTASAFDATSGGNAVAAGGTIARWQDKSGNGRHFVQAGSTLQPTLTASGRNGRSVVTFDATNDCMTSAATQNIAQPATWIFVYKTPSSVASGWALVDSSVDRVHVYSASGSDLRMYTAGGSIVLESSVVADTWRIGTYHFNGASSQGRSNGVQSATGTTGTVAVNGTIYLASNGGATTFRGQMAEAILLTNASLADIARVEAYLAAKWGISGVHAPATATSDPVGYWGDKSGNGRHATQATGPARPTVAAASINSRGTVAFAGALSQRLGATVPGTDGQLYTVLAVVQNATSANGVLMGERGGNFSTALHFQQTPNKLTWYGGGRQEIVYGPHGGTTWLYGISKDSASLFRGYQNGALAFSADGVVVGGQHIGNLLRNIGSSTAGANAFTGNIAELIAYPSSLSNGDRRRLERYLAAKWGITLAPQVSNADAQDWINRVYANGGTVSASTAAAVNQFCNDIDYGVSGASIRDRFYRLNLFCGGTSGTAVGLNSALVPLYRGPSLGGTQYGNTTDINSGGLFVSADYSESAGITGNGSTGSKFLNPGTCATLKPSWVTHHFGIDISGAFPDATNRYIIGAFFNETPTSPRGQYAISGYNTAIRLDSGMPSRGAYTTASNLKWAIRSSASDLRAYEDNTQSGSTQNAVDTASVLPGGAFAIMASSYQNVSAGTPTTIVNGYAHSVGTCRGYTIGEAMDATQRSAFVSAWIAFQQTMGRR
jgi:hypothetical protein